ncbi:hypothetical protein KFE25_005324 [Diacronema lutheri]|uniref:RimM N-terminal domain-containing protein n=1 Tax=Diacronema lutheri TaxID=2081491 RepID=A0A8J5XSI3_DIALT|nr:hypothetical protein KFE25_005324 [Diacronema lutheri]
MAVRVTLALVLAAPTRLAAPSTVARPGVVPAARARERALARATVGDVDPFEATPSAAPRERRNKYAQFSRADDEYGARLERGELGGPVERKSRVRRRPITLRRAPSEPRERGVITYPDAAAVDPTDPTTFGFCEIGRVVGAHGVRGDVKVQSDTDFATERLCTPGVRYLKVPTRRAPREVVVTSGVLARTLKEGLGAIYIVRIEGVEDRDDADALRGCTLFTRDGPAPASLARDRDEYLVREVVGRSARTSTCPRAGS